MVLIMMVHRRHYYLKTPIVALWSSLHFIIIFLRSTCYTLFFLKNSSCIFFLSMIKQNTALPVPSFYHLVPLRSINLCVGKHGTDGLTLHLLSNTWRVVVKVSNHRLLTNPSNLWFLCPTPDLQDQSYIKLFHRQCTNYHGSFLHCLNLTRCSSNWRAVAAV